MAAYGNESGEFESEVGAYAHHGSQTCPRCHGFVVPMGANHVQAAFGIRPDGTWGKCRSCGAEYGI